MRTRLSAALLAGTAVLAASSSTVAVHAAAATTWTVSPGGKAAAKSIAGTITLTDTRTGSVGTCASSKAAGRVKAGSGLSGQDIGKVTKAAFGSCVALGLVTLKVTATGLPWRISFTSYDAKTGAVLGTVSGIKVELTGKYCDAVINGPSGPAADGVVRAIYNDRTTELTFLSSGGNLHYWHVKRCYRDINDGDPVALTASYLITPIQDITSP